MMPTLKEGDAVRIVRREATEEDVKAERYFSFFGGLTGSVRKVYSKEEIAVEVDLESLPVEVRKRHLGVRDQMKTKWLDGLSEEGRGKLTEREKDFHLRYMLLVAGNDLEKVRAPTAPAPETPAKAAAPPTLEEIAASRKTLSDLEAAEEAELRRRTQA
jgi:hypothetical protein